MRRAYQSAQPVGAPEAEGAEDGGERRFEIGDGDRPGIQGGERIDHHDLAVEAGEVVAEEGAHHGVAIGLVAAVHHAGERALRPFVVVFEAERREGEGRRIVEVAGHQEAARRLGGEQARVGAAAGEIGGEGVGQLARQRLVGGRVRVDVGQPLQPRNGMVAVAVAAGGGKRLARPFGVALGEQRQVEQPFAGIVDDVDVAAGRCRWCGSAATPNS